MSGICREAEPMTRRTDSCAAPVSRVRPFSFSGVLNEPPSPLPPDHRLSVPEHSRCSVIRPLLLHR